jgi:hypothetical protein
MTLAKALAIASSLSKQIDQQLVSPETAVRGISGHRWEETRRLDLMVNLVYKDGVPPSP